MTDPVADMLTRIRNANQRYYEKVSMPASRVKEAIAKVFKKEGYLKDYKVIKNKNMKTLVLFLKYEPGGNRLINRIIRVSKPGRRVYRGVDELGKVLDGLGIAVVSTSKGMMSDKECRKLKIGGELICQVW